MIIFDLSLYLQFFLFLLPFLKEDDSKFDVVSSLLNMSICIFIFLLLKYVPDWAHKVSDKIPIIVYNVV